MWTCPQCERAFGRDNQSHMCTGALKDIWEIMEGRSDELLLAFDSLMSALLEWEPCSVGASKHSAIFTNTRAWLIVKPMSRALDLKFYMPAPMEHPLLHKVHTYRNKHSHHVRVEGEHGLTPELFDLLRAAYDQALG